MFHIIWSCRSVYDNENLNVFQEGLESRIKLHEKEIERMCNKNYQGFIESVSELLKVQSEAKKLRVCKSLASHASHTLISYYAIAVCHLTKSGQNCPMSDQSN